MLLYKTKGGRCHLGVAHQTQSQGSWVRHCSGASFIKYFTSLAQVVPCPIQHSQWKKLPKTSAFYFIFSYKTLSMRLCLWRFHTFLCSYHRQVLAKKLFIRHIKFVSLSSTFLRGMPHIFFYMLAFFTSCIFVSEHNLYNFLSTVVTNYVIPITFSYANSLHLHHTTFA